jgi:hypothetical protein
MSFDEDNQPIKAVQFEYPIEELPTVVDDKRMRELLDFLVYYILPNKNPNLCLMALLFNAGYDIGSIYNTDNTIRAIAKANGITHIKLYTVVKEIENELNLKLRINNGNKRTSSKISGSLQ